MSLSADQFGHKLYLISGVNHFDLAESCFVNKLGAIKSMSDLVRYYNGSEFHASCLENPQTMEASLDFKISPFLCFLISFCYQYFGLEDFPLEYAAYLTRCYYVPLFY